MEEYKDDAAAWPGCHKTLSNQLWYFYEHQIETDMEVYMINRKSQEMRRYNCHKLVFMRLSVKFQKMLSDRDRSLEGDSCVLELNWVSPETFGLIMRFAYTDTVKKINSYDQIMELKTFCQTYKIITLLYQCDVFISQLNVDKNMFWDLIEKRDELSLKTRLKMKKYITDNTMKCLESEKFLACSQSSLLEVLSSDTLAIASELQLVQAVLRWAKAHTDDGENLNPKLCRQLLGPCFGQLRFLALTPAEFSQHVATSGLFTSEESLKILMSLTLDEPKDLPEGVSTISEPRAPPVSANFSNGNKASGQTDEASRALNKLTQLVKQINISTNESVSKDLIRFHRSVNADQVPPVMSTPKKLFVTSILVDTPMMLHAIELAARVKHGSTPIASDTYEECLHLHVRSHGSTKKQHITFHTFISHHVEYGSVVKIAFSRPGLLEPGEAYNIECNFKNFGIYPCDSRSSVVSSEGVTLNVVSDDEQYPFSGLVHSLYLSKVH